MTAGATCELCRESGGTVLWSDDACRVVLVDDLDYPGFCRVIWNAHVKEMTDLADVQRLHFMNVVFAVEGVLRTVLQPDKINLASFGNMTPHLHWHVIPRYKHDRHFPNPVWGAEVNQTLAVVPQGLEQQLRLELQKRITN